VDFTLMTAPTVKPPKPVCHVPVRFRERPAIEMVAIDIDGTLLTTDKRISHHNIEAIRATARSGVRVVLASARPPRSMRELYGHLGLDTLQVNYNGALIHDPVRRRHVHHQPLSSVVARKVIRVARSLYPAMVVSVEILDKWYTDHVDESLPTETSRAFTPDFIGPLDAFLHVPVTKVMLLGQPAWMPAVRAAVATKCAGQVGIAVSDAHLLQVVHPQVDKAIALARVARQYDIAPERVMAIGDAPNDVGMIAWAGLGVAVENAWQEARDAADAIVPANDEDGVAFALKRYVLD
jgi:Cof subfamily protein (haloacid dehalogenase superfamily)